MLLKAAPEPTDRVVLALSCADTIAFRCVFLAGLTSLEKAEPWLVSWVTGGVKQAVGQEAEERSQCV